MLADLIPTLPPDDVLPLGRQIAEALEAAHEQGIVQIATSAHADLAGAMG